MHAHQELRVTGIATDVKHEIPPLGDLKHPIDFDRDAKRQ